MHLFPATSKNQDDDDEDDDVKTHGDTSPDPGEENYTDPKIGEGAGEDEAAPL